MHHGPGEGGKNPAACCIHPEGKLRVPLHCPQKFLLHLSILNGEEIANVCFRYDNAVRKYVERHLWDD